MLWFAFGLKIMKYAAFGQLENRICLHWAGRASQGNSNFSNNDQAIERNDVPPTRQHRVGNLASGGGEFLNSSEDHAAGTADAVA